MTLISRRSSVTPDRAKGRARAIRQARPEDFFCVRTQPSPPPRIAMVATSSTVAVLAMLLISL